MIQEIMNWIGKYFIEIISIIVVFYITFKYKKNIAEIYNNLKNRLARGKSQLIGKRNLKEDEKKVITK
jgi:hypothetical protein